MQKRHQNIVSFGLSRRLNCCEHMKNDKSRLLRTYFEHDLVLEARQDTRGDPLGIACRTNHNDREAGQSPSLLERCNAVL